MALWRGNFRIFLCSFSKHKEKTDNNILKCLKKNQQALFWLGCTQNRYLKAIIPYKCYTIWHVLVYTKVNKANTQIQSLDVIYVILRDINKRNNTQWWIMFYKSIIIFFYIIFTIKYKCIHHFYILMNLTKILLRMMVYIYILLKTYK
jgi:hypothetical protein